MPRTIYDKPTRALLKDMLASWNLQPGQVFTSERAVEWFASRYPKLKRVTIQAHLVQASTNDKNRLHHSSTNQSDDLLFKVDRGQYRLYDQKSDPAPIHELVEGDVLRQQEHGAPDEEEESAQGAGASEFLLERDLQSFLAAHLDVIEPGLVMFDDEGMRGLEYEAGGGRRIDILAMDKDNNFVVLELKVSRGYDRVIGQLLRYMNWVRRELAESGQRVRGIIICRTMSEDLRLACASIPDVELFEYKLSVTVSKVKRLDMPS